METVIPDSEEIQKRIDKVSSHRDDPIMVVAVDGAYVSTRPEGSRSKKRGAGQYKDASEFFKDFRWIASQIPRR